MMASSSVAAVVVKRDSNGVPPVGMLSLTASEVSRHQCISNLPHKLVLINICELQKAKCSGAPRHRVYISLVIAP